MPEPHFRPDATLHALVVEQCLRTPHAIALVTDREQLTYRELLTRAERLARYLIGRGVRLEEPVGVCLERSADLPISLLAVLLSGGSYLPLDPNYPRDRVGFMLDDARSRFVLTRRELAGLFTERPAEELEQIYLEELELPKAAPNEVGRLGEYSLPQALAYLIYTSGSTGRPKGVAIDHANAAAFCAWAATVFTPAEMRGVFAGTSVCFDLSIFEIFFTLSCGGTIILGRDALHLPSHPARDRVTLINTVPSAITELVRLKAIPPQVLTVNLAGEPLKRALTDEIYATAPGVEKVYNLYGPSEDTTYSTWAWVPKGSSEEPTIGIPLAGSEGYILGPRGELLADGEIGELYLGGRGVSRGYLGRPSQTAERYVPDPFSGRVGARLYKTGDRVRRRADGELEYLGRFDHQVKIRGFRIELGEIEAAMAHHPAVEMPLALVREDVPGDKRIVGYFQVKEGHAEPEAAELRTHLDDFLPHYMVPSAFVGLDKMPLTPNGKIDRKVLAALPPPTLKPAAARAKAGPRSPLEELLLALFQEVLGSQELGIYDSFFEWGGHSLLAARAVGEIERALGIFCPQRQLFATPTVAGLAEALEQAEEKPLQPIPHRERGAGPLPVAPGQLGLFYVWLLEKNAAHYNTVVTLGLRGRLNVPALARALHQLVERHEILRCRFLVEDGLPVALLEPPFAPLAAIADLRQDPTPDATALRRAADEARRPFDLVSDRLWRCSLFRLGEEDYLLQLVQHHITTDGLSLQIFFRELGLLYQAEVSGDPAKLPPLPITFFDFAEWQNQEQADNAPARERWRQRLAALPETNLPTDHPRPTRSAHRGGNLALTLPASTAAAVEALARRHGQTFFLVAAAAFYGFVASFVANGRRDVTLGIPRAGRNHPDTHGLLGYFIKVLPVRLVLPDDPTFLETLDLVRQSQLAAWDDEDVAFHQLAAELAPHRQLSRNPFFDIVFQVRDDYFAPDFLPGLVAERQAISAQTSKFDLEVALVHQGGGHYVSEVEYDSELFESATVQRLLENFHHFLAQAVQNPHQRLSQLDSASAVAALPRNTSLPAAPPAAEKRPLLAPATRRELEERLHDLWCELLVLPEIDPTAHFFALGGHSLLAARLIFRIGERFGVELPLEAIYEAPSIQLLAEKIASALTTPGAAAPTGGSVASPSVAKAVLSWGEERLVFAHLLEPRAATYNIPIAAVIEGPLDLQALERALATLETRHEILRTTFQPTREGVVPQVHPPAFRLETFALPPAAGLAELAALADEEARRPFDLRVGPVWRARLGVGDPSPQPNPQGHARYLLALVLHHVVADGWSIEVLFRELQALYAAYHDQRSDPLPKLPLQVRDLATEQRAKETVAHLAQRQRELAGMRRGELPPDRPRPPVFVSRGEQVVVELAPELLDAARRFAAAQDASLFQVLLAAFFAFLAQRSGPDLAIGIPTSGRERADTELLIGYFVNTLVVRVDLRGNPDFLEILTRTRQALLAAQKHAVPFEKLVEAINPERDLSRPVLISTFFQVFDGELDLNLPGLACHMLDPWSGTCKFETDWAIVRRGGRHVVELECSAGLFTRATAEAFVRDFLAVLSGAVREAAVREASPLSPTSLPQLGASPANVAPTPVATVAAPVATVAAGDLAASRGLRRDGVERLISVLWGEVLQIDHVGLDDNFFDLGGHSLLLPRVLSHLALTWPDLALLDLFLHPSVRSLAAHLRTLQKAEPATAPPADPAPASTAPASTAPASTASTSTAPASTAPTAASAMPAPLPAPAPPNEAHAHEGHDAIAIVGMAGRFPGAADIESFWQLIVTGKETLRPFTDDELLAAGISPELLAQQNYVKAGAEIDGVELFDPSFFGYSQREAELIDPQQRLFLECAWEALERAGHPPGGPIGVFAGIGQSGYLLHHLVSRPDRVAELTDLTVALATDKDYLATRVAYKLDLRGPALTVQTACSSSLVAVHQACRSLRDGECELALAGGVTLQIPQRAGYRYLPGGIVSPDGHCRPFDREAAGMVASSGVGVVLLRPLAAALAAGDPIWAVIRGTAINNDGAEKIGFTAPSAAGQRAVIERALQRAACPASSLGYVECHGTATALGDAIEMTALREVFRDAAPGSVTLGSLKSQVGHMDAAAGIGGLIRAALAVHHGYFPPTLHFREPHPDLRLEGSPFRLTAQATPWPIQGAPRRAGVSSFGIGGTNAHVVLEGPPAIPSSPGVEARHQHLLLLSAKTTTALDSMATRLAAALEATHDGDAPRGEARELELAAVALTLHRGRARLPKRRSFVAADLPEAIAALRGPSEQRGEGEANGERPIYFLYPGQGSQHLGMAAEIYRSERVFREEFDACCEVLAPELGCDLRQLIWAGDDPVPRDPAAAARLQSTALAQPALFAIEWSLDRLWRHWGLQPDGLLGHSLGEFVAATAAGVFSRDQALRLVAARGRLMASLPAGAMLALSVGEEELAPWLPADLALATQNGPRNLVVAGPIPAIERFSQELTARGLVHRRLHTSHAFHSPAMDPILDEFAALVRQATPQRPTLPYLSNLTGDWVTPEEATDPRAWARHLRHTVRFGDALGRLFAQEEAILLEVGPGRALTALARRHPGRGALSERQIVPSLPHAQEPRGDLAALLSAVGQLWTLGAEVDAEAFFAGRPGRRQVLPTYPFERRRCWIDAATRDSATSAQPVNPAPDDAAVEIPKLPSSPETLATPHGASLPKAAEVGAAALAITAPAGAEALEQVLALWRNILGGQVDADSNFLALGGDSLSALQLLDGLQSRFGGSWSLQEILFGKTQTPRQQAAAISTRGETFPQPEKVVVADLPDLPPTSAETAMAPGASPPTLKEAPLPYGLERLWLVSQLGEAASVAYHIVTTLQLRGVLDPTRFKLAFSQIVDRHAILRTGLVLREGKPLQIIHPTLEWELPVVELQGTDAERREKFQALAAERAHRPFDLAEPPLFRLLLGVTGRRETWLSMVFHHTVFDGASFEILFRELDEAYRALPLPPLPISVAELALRQRQRLESGALDGDLAYWRQHFAGAPPLLELPTDHPRPQMPSFAGGQVAWELPAPLVAELRELQKAVGCTSFAPLLALLALGLSRWSGQRDLMIGTPMTTRGLAGPGLEARDSAGLIGFFVQTVVLRLRLDPQSSFREWVMAVRDEQMAALAHLELPFERLVEELVTERSASVNPLFQVMFVLEREVASRDQLCGFRFEGFEADTQFAHFDLTFRVIEGNAGMRLTLDYARDLFERDTLQRWSQQLMTLLQHALADPDAPLASLPALPEAERQRILHAARGEARLFALGPARDTLDGLFRQQVARTPLAPAVVGLDAEGAFGTWSYTELDQSADHVAAALLAAPEPLPPGAPVAVCLPSGRWAVAAVLGILRAGGYYVPLDPTAPPERLVALIRQAGCRQILVAGPPPSGLVEAGLAAQWLRVDQLPAGQMAPRQLDPALPAYLIFTSGSTGTPKGVLVTHAAAVNLCHAFVSTHGFQAGQRWLVLPPLYFDASVGDLFPALASGGCLIFHPRPELLDGESLLSFCGAQRVTVIDTAAAVFKQWLDGWGHLPVGSVLPDLAVLMLGGEAVGIDQLRRFLELQGGKAKIFNHYGPTEATVCATLTQLTGERAAGHGRVRPSAAGAPLPDLTQNLPIGRPLPNIETYVVDFRLELQPVGIPGELVIGGAGLALGYVGAPGRTAAAFVPDPFSGRPGARLYRTGDRVRLRPDYQIEFLGRVDRQVKLRGYRIELGEIEAQLRRHPAIAEAVVVVRDDGAGTASRSSAQRLVAYLTLSPGAAANAAIWREFAHQQLPSYMVPTAFVVLDTLPLTANGKVDLKALPAPENTSAIPQRRPTTPLARQLAELWRELLGHEPALEDDFFESGGNSLSLMQLATRLREDLGRQVALPRLFEASRLEDMAHVLESATALPPAPLDLRAKVRLDPAIRPGLRTRALRPIGEREAFVTGGTGFLGAYLIDAWLRQERGKVHVLVRAESADEARIRLRKNLQQYGLWRDDAAFRLVPVLGQLDRPRFGLTPEAFAELAHSLDVIFHNAATVNFLAPYGRLEKANVQGTVETLRLACLGGGTPLHFISTLGVFLQERYERQVVTEDDDPAPDGLHQGYEQTKWVAEKLVETARQRGLPATIHRPARVAGSSHDGAANTADVFYSFIQGCVQLGAAPEVEDPIDLYPVDVLARCIVALSQGHDADPAYRGRSYHYYNGGTVPSAELIRSLVRFGLPIQLLPYAAWRRRLTEALAAGEANALEPFLGLYPEEAQEDRQPTFDTRHSAGWLAEQGIVLPPANEKLLRTYWSFLRRSGFLSNLS